MADINHPSSGDKNDAEKSENFPVKPARSAGSFAGENSSETSIGPGTSDQGFEPGEEDRDDEFRNENTIKEVILDKENVHHSERPTHGLVEEGPGPDS